MPSSRSTPSLDARYAVLLLGLLLAAGVLFVWGMAVRSDLEMRAELLQQSRLIAQGVNLGSVKALTASAADLEKPGYNRLKEQLAAVRAENPRCRYLYLAGRSPAGKVFFYADSEPAGTKDYSPPGEEYEEVSDVFRAVFDTRAASVEGPVPDRWGVWVSALVPLTDPATGAVVAVLGMDVDASNWRWEMASRAALPVGLMLVLLIGAALLVIAARRVGASPKPVLRRLLPSLTVMVALLLGGAWALLYQQHRLQLASNRAAFDAEVAGNLRQAVEQETHSLGAVAQLVAAKEGVRAALRLGDSRRLLADWQPVFEQLRREHHITHFYFLDPSRGCLVRVHRPEESGGRIDHFTARQAERTGRAEAGLELGGHGTFALRVVQPVYDGATLVGYVEMGEAIEEVLHATTSRPGELRAVLIRKDLLHETDWEGNMSRLGRRSTWGQLPTRVVAFAAPAPLPDVFAAWADPPAGGPNLPVTGRELTFDGKPWLISSTPLPDAAGQVVGELLVMRDSSATAAEYTRLLTLGGTSGAVVLVLLLATIFVLLRRTDAAILAQQAALRESEESYRNQFAKNSAAMLLIDAHDGAIVDANAAAQAFYGHPRDRLLAMNIADLNTLPRNEVRRLVGSVTEGQGTRFEFQHRLADGTMRDVDVAVTRVQFGGRAILHSIVQDVTARKRAEQVLRENERHLSAAQAQGHLGSWSWDLSTNTNTWSAENHAILGYVPGAVVPTQTLFTAALHPEDRARVLAAMDAAIRDRRSYEVDCRIVRPTGEVRFVQCRGEAQLSPEGRVTGMAGTVLDITARKAAETALQLTQFTVDHMTDAIFWISPEARILYVNEAACRALGYTREELLTKTIHEIDPHFPPAAWPAHWAELKQRGSFTFKSAHVTRRGASIPTEVTVNYLQFDGREYNCAVMRDISERLRSERERENLAAQLLQSQKLETLGQLAGGIAHDFNNLLLVIQGNTELLETGEPLSPAQRAQLRQITQAGDRAADLTNQLLLFSRRQAPSRRDLDLNATVAETVKMLQRIIGEHIRLRLEYAPEAQRISADAGMVGQILINLAVNARDAMPGGGELTIRTEPVGANGPSGEGDPARPDRRIIRRRAEDQALPPLAPARVGAYVCLSVADQGCGMTPEVLAHIFEPFFTTKEIGKGTGLGLATVYGIVQQHGGWIEVDSEPGQGSVFRIFLPKL